ncbi:DegT/DnrJ/EryC1/StrS family aminotransferase [Streptomyces sp. NBC_01136]|uniref:DegT/DnrJ/EryC1/StrS family aminotransferase n=1 Tax=unclassified Streptomyces TaxID=2593676 RepID=UPI00324E364F|nr:DegT/DnrJ/EryC1/StrS family aminotransferase [Streptomyces sp. NBC_01136]
MTAVDQTDPVPIWRTFLPPQVRRQAHLEVAQILKTGRMVDGPLTERLEAAVSQAFARAAVAVASGMDALELLLEAFDARGRDVLIPANCFPSIPALAQQLGAHPIPAPVDPGQLALAQDTAALEAAVRRPIIVWVHHAGLVAPYARATITAFRSAGHTVIEDCAYLLPDDQPRDGPGTRGDAALISFAPTKPISGNGGGIALLRDPHLADLVRTRRSHSGQEVRWEGGDRIHRSRTITEISAALAHGQWQQRAKTRTALRHIADAYQGAFAGHACQALPEGRIPQDTWGRFPVDLGSPDAAWTMRDCMAKDGIATTVMFERPWSDYPAFHTKPGVLDGLHDRLQRTVCIPYHPTLRLSDAQRVAAYVTDAFTPGGPR